MSHRFKNQQNMRIIFCFRHMTLLLGMMKLISAADGCPTKCQCLGKVLHCAARGLQSFPAFLQETTLQLYIENNSISSLNILKTMNKLQLHTLTLQNNQIAHLPPSTFSRVAALNYLDLSGNNLETISRNAFAKLGQLRLLNLANNKLTTLLPRAFSDLKSLGELFLSNNLISVLPSGIFSSLSSLTTLHIDHNAIHRIQDGLLSPLSSLRHLNMDNNKISRMTFAKLQGLTRLQELHLRKNKIKNIDPQFYISKQHCPEESDDSAEQRMESSGPGCFSNLRSLQFLDLSNNQLQAIKYLSFSALPRLTTLDLSGNPWRCDCFLKWSLIRLNRNHGRKSLDPGPMSCWEPEALRGVSLVDISMQEISELQTSIYPTQANENPASIILPVMNAKRSLTTAQTPFFSPRISFQRRKINGIAYSENGHPHKRPDPLLRHAEINPSVNSFTEHFAPNRTETVAPERSQMLNLLPATQATVDVGNRDVTEHVIHTSNRKNDRPENNKKFNSIKILTSSLRNVLVQNKNTFVTSPPDSMKTNPNIQNAGSPADQNQNNQQITEPNQSVFRQDDVILWLIVAVIFTVAVSAVICAAVTLGKQFNQDGNLCGCCPKKSAGVKSPNSESIRSISNYPLLYDNPLARRPLPRQPMQPYRDQNPRPGQPLRTYNTNGEVDIRWTCGGAFGIGGSNESSPSRFSISPTRSDYNRRNREIYPPVVPPRLPRNMCSWSERTNNYNPNFLAPPIQDHGRSSHNKLRKPFGESASFSDIRGYPASQEERFEVTPYHSQQHLQYLQPRLTLKGNTKTSSRRRRPESAIGIEKNPVTGDFDLVTDGFLPQPVYNDQSISAPLSRQNSQSKDEVNFRGERRSKRDHMVAQMLDALREIDTVRKNSNASDIKKSNNNSLDDDPPSPLSLQRKSASESVGGKLVSSSESSKSRNGLQEGPNKDYAGKLKKYRPKNQKSRNRSRVKPLDLPLKPIRASHPTHISEVDFEFPPPPPCATTSCSEESQAYSSSVSEASYDVTLLPLPPKSHFSDPTSSTELPLRSSQRKKQEISKSAPPNQDEQNSYSVLSLCSTGEHERKKLKMPGNTGYVMREKDYKRKNNDVRKQKKTDLEFRDRKESIDSMFVSIDSNCESVSSSDLEDHVLSKPEHITTAEHYTATEVKYRNTRREAIQHRLRQLKEEYRKSMPIYNELLRRSTHISDSERKKLLQKSKSLLRSDKYLCASRNLNSENHSWESEIYRRTASRLELSCSESDPEQLTASAEMEARKKILMRSRSSSTGSTATITPTDETCNERKDRPCHSRQSRFKEHQLSVSSLGSESVSSIEFGSFLASPKPQSSHTENIGNTTTFEKLPFTKGAVVQLRKVLHKRNNSNDDDTRACSSKVVNQDFSRADKRGYFDVLESSADEVSTDVELLDLSNV